MFVVTLAIFAEFSRILIRLNLFFFRILLIFEEIIQNSLKIRLNIKNCPKHLKKFQLVCYVIVCFLLIFPDFLTIF